ncbi:phage tail sheath subtilisin-like domain-containing protein [Variovorax sp. J22R24]|uniref:phage tail sheath family protein n=1 Tax=Variovorax gracilis TaxID=3053502 RepID=UPI002574EA8E|nr:phage tail sheath C-terminal domain-containing protein [Variovorax sp. J22R24]MDM0109620.1 phage tail sheath subtilisin-like domain-containing protein [Variovorax sp. J22R24]
MPEYLAPAVYVEEVDTGSKPIEGVSTSTCGMVGVTERGPVAMPILVTSYGEYRRWFGDGLNPGLYGEHCFMPHAVDGFFTNGGKRVYVTRVLSPAAAPAELRLLSEDPVAPVATQLAFGAAPGDGTVLVVDSTGLAAPATVQIGSGVGAEFRGILGALAPGNVLALDLPLAYGHAAGVPNSVQAIAAPAADVAPNDYSSTLAAPAAAGASGLDAVSAAPPTNALIAGDLLSIGSAGTQEFAFVGGLVAGNTITLLAPLQRDHAAGVPVVRLAPPGPPAAQTQLASAGMPDASMLRLQTTVGFTTALVRFDDANPAHVEVRRIGVLSRITLTQAAYADYPAGSRIEQVSLPAAGPAFDLAADAALGASVVRVSDRSALLVGDVLQIGVGVDLERLAVVGLPAPLPGLNAGNVVLGAGLRRAHAAAVGVVRRVGPPTGVTQTLVAAANTAVGSLALVAAPPTALAAADILRVSTPAGGISYHEVAATPTALTPQLVSLDQPLTLAQAAGAALVVRAPMLVLRALDAGVWGNRLRAAMEVQTDSLLNTHVRQIASATSLRLDSAAGIETGTELTVVDAGGVETRVKVAAIDRQNDYLINLEPAFPLPGASAVGDAARSREYRFVVELLRQPDATNPQRNNQAIDREVFANLSIDPRHSRYFQSVIGATWDMGNPAVTLDAMGRPLRREDRRSRGDSGYIRVLDLAPGLYIRPDGTPGFGVRPTPVATYETRPGVPRRLVLLPIAHGDDALAAPFGDTDYIGTDDPEPERRTGLQTLRNIEEISVVSAPGRTSVSIQAALINHCELMRYRFAVLDGSPPPTDSLADIQAQRQQFDTKYAALYHPWLLIPDPYPQSVGTVPEYPVPPSGHMLGVYARTDIDRGVHKAPANEVVRGVIGLQRVLNKEQHDILNPYPLNINVIRDFRPNNRGIRVYGGRVITSDSDWKYVNVRRLLIFIEASIDRGLQWVVFEPNAEPLWARVRRSISNFLTLVWRNGALEGTKPEEAYFVKCDRTTMTQTDIDQGRLICLVGVAPVKPAEFVIVRIGLWTAHADD